MVLDAVGVVQPIQETNLLQDILPFLQALLSVVGHLLDLVSVKLFVATLVVLVRHREWRIDTIGGELGDALLIADRCEVLAVDGADSQHFLLLNSELLILTFVLNGVLL